MKKIKHFYTLADFSLEEINYLIDSAVKLKNGSISFGEKLAGKTLAMLFFNSSLRTRTSFASAMHKLGGLAIDLPIKEGGVYGFEFEKGAVMGKQKAEHVKEAAKVLSRYCDVIAIRQCQGTTLTGVFTNSWQETKKDVAINSFIEYADIPVINMESNVFHPCQGLGDAMTIKSKIKSQKSKIKYVLTWAPHPKALPVATPHSQLMGACSLGMDVVLTHPPGWSLDKEVLKTAEKRAKKTNGSLSVSNNQKKALKEANIICAKSWGSLKYYGDWEKEMELRKNYQNWMVTKEKMALGDNACFMHCLPVRRNVVATDEVLDSVNSLIYDQAENRIWAQMAILLRLMQK